MIFEELSDSYRKEILQSRLIMAEGKVQIEGEVIHMIAQRCYDLSKLLRQLNPAREDQPSVLTLAYANKRSIPAHAQNKKSQVRQPGKERVFPGGRNFK